METLNTQKLFKFQEGNYNKQVSQLIDFLQKTILGGNRTFVLAVNVIPESEFESE